MCLRQCSPYTANGVERLLPGSQMSRRVLRCKISTCRINNFDVNDAEKLNSALPGELRVLRRRHRETISICNTNHLHVIHDTKISGKVANMLVPEL